MKKILLGLLLSTTTWAISSGDKATYSNKYQNGADPNGINYIVNPSCLRNAVGLTGTNTTPSRNTTTPLTSIADCQSTLDSATDTVDFTTNTLDRVLKNGNCEVGIRYKLTLGSGNTIQLQARINSATVASADLVTSDNGTAVVNFPCGDLSNAPSLRIAQTAGSSSQAINVANVYLGAARNIGTVAQAQLWGGVKWAGTTSCQWGTTSTTFGNYSTDADCTLPTGSNIYANASAPATKVPAITFANLPPGEYQVVASGGFQANGGTNPSCSWRFHDGTTGSAPQRLYVGGGGAIETNTLVGRFVYTTAQTNVTINIQAAGDATATCYVSSDDASDSASRELELRLYRFPSSSEIAVRNGQNPAWGSSLLSKASITSAQYTTTTWTTMNNAGYTGQTFVGNASATTSSGDLGIKLPNLPAGTYQIIAQGGFYSTSSSVCVFGFYDGTTREVAGYVGSAPGFSPTLAGLFTYTSQADRNIVLQVHSFSTATLCGVDVGDGANVNAPTFRITVIPISQAMPSPILVGSVTSNSTGAERVERVYVSSQCTSNPCTITSQSGSWVSSIGRTATGTYELNIASGIFSATPVCQILIIEHAGYSIPYVYPSPAPSSTYLKFAASDQQATGTLKDNGFMIMCMGPK